MILLTSSQSTNASGVLEYPGRHSYILSFIRNDLDLPRELIKITIALDAANVRPKDA